MKVFSADTMREMENLAYKQGVKEETFMENAGLNIAKAVVTFITENQLEKKVLLLCAKGNNSGDAYVAGRNLLQQGFSVYSKQTTPIEKCSPLCQKNYYLYLEKGGKILETEDFSQCSVILDGLFGTGFKGKIEEPQLSVINKANQSLVPILSIDIPSGVNGNTGIVENVAINATKTLYLAAPKLGFFLNNGFEHIGTLQFIDFGLPEKFINQHPAEMVLNREVDLKPLLPKTKRTWHKYERGYVVGFAGSFNMPGAAILSSLAALSNNTGIVRLIYPKGMEIELASAPIELVRQPYEKDKLDPILESMNKASSIFIGPGLGRDPSTEKTLRFILEHINTPCVIDADALTLIAENNIPLPKESILTPHIGEAMRLLKIKEKVPTEKMLLLCREYVEKHSVTLVLKGAPTFILSPNLPTYVNISGDLGMATAGSGDVLTGIIAAFLAHKMPPVEAARLGVYLHGVAGELAAQEKSICYLASDLIHSIPKFYKKMISKYIAC